MRHKDWAKSGLAQLYKAGAWEVLNNGYSESHRAYHAWKHIDDLLNKLTEFQHLAARPDLIRHAILWHDVVYVTQNADGTGRPDSENVKDSADLFMIYSTLPDNEKRAVYAMIMATAKHMNPDDVGEFYSGFKRDRDLFLDLDLASLAVNEDVFDRNTDDIRFEFKWVDEKLFCASRARILEKFAAANPTYKTPDLEVLWGQKARTNLIRSSQALAARAAAL